MFCNGSCRKCCRNVRRVTSEPAPDEPVTPDPAGREDGLETWLSSRAPGGRLSTKSRAVVHVLHTKPRTASYGGAAEVAQLAGATVATVTRTAQALGFDGWPALQQELRARYLSSLSAPQVAAEHGSLTDAASAASLRRDVDDLAVLSRSTDPAAVVAVARAIAGARRTLVIASGSYAAVGIALAHNAGLAGYDVQLHDGASASMVNALARVGPEDVVVTVSFWRLYTSAVRAAQAAAERGATVCSVTDSASGPLAAAARHVLLVPAEGVSFFPSLTPALAVVQAVCAELATLDPARTRASVEAADGLWDAFGILDRAPRRP
ncbi:MurR/RpiR family transcriptional regulator [Kineosporiaceae bacterium B12]|nr:MurR/RpiR family transcriptional regulator [Kineococcus rubinsiae]